MNGGVRARRRAPHRGSREHVGRACHSGRGIGHSSLALRARLSRLRSEFFRSRVVLRIKWQEVHCQIWLRMRFEKVVASDLYGMKCFVVRVLVVSHKWAWELIDSG
jgi:hypothetical protein